MAASPGRIAGDARSVGVARLAGATALAGASAIGAVGALIRGFELSLSLCAFGGCDEPEDSALGGWLLLAGVAIAAMGLFVAPRLARSDRPLARAAVAVGAALLFGGFLFAVGFPGVAPWAENVTLYGMMVAVVVLLVPPRGAIAIGGVLVGALVAAAFGDVAMPGLGVALIVVVAAVALGELASDG